MMKKRIISLLKTILDPEIGVSVWDLGLIYDILIDGGQVVIKMTLTATGCPFMTQLVDQVREQVRALEGVEAVRVDLVFDPPWDPKMVTEQGRKKLGWE